MSLIRGRGGWGECIDNTEMETAGTTCYYMALDARWRRPTHFSTQNILREMRQFSRDLEETSLEPAEVGANSFRAAIAERAAGKD